MKPLPKLFAALLPLAFLAACGGGSDDDLDDRLDLADPKIRVVHAAPLSPNVSLQRGDVPMAAATDLAYKSATNYFDVSTSEETWNLVTATTPAVTIGSQRIDASRGKKYTLLAVPDSLGTGAELAFINDPYNNKSVASDNARVRVFNAAFNTGAVDVYITAPAADIATLAPTIANVGYKAAVPASGDDSVVMEGNNYQLRLTTAGTKTVVFNAQVSLARNADWLLVPVPASLTPNDTRVLVVQSDSSSPATELANTP